MKVISKRVNKVESEQNRPCAIAPPRTIVPSYKGQKLCTTEHGSKRAAWRSVSSSISKSFQPQFGTEFLSSGLSSLVAVNELVENLSKFSNVQLPDDVIPQIEDIVSLFFALREVQSVSQFFGIIFPHIRNRYPQSISVAIIKYLTNMFKASGIEPQCGTENSSWVQSIRDCFQNWKLLKSNKFFGQISTLLGILVTVGLCDASRLTFSIAGFEIIKPDLLKSHASAWDLVDALFSTVKSFAEGLYLCFQTGSLKPFLISDIAANELEEQYVEYLQWWDFVKNGNLEKFTKVTESEFIMRGKSVTSQFKALAQTLKGMEKKVVNDKIYKLAMIDNEYVTMRVSGSIREAPFGVLLNGDSSQGKTTFGEMVIDALLASQGLPMEKEYRATINPADKFWSNWSSEKIVCKIDDMANEKSTFVQANPTRAIIDIMNNERFYAPKAEIDAKGKCFVEPKLLVVTTNTQNLEAGTYSNCPFSIQRRLLSVTVKVKPEFTDSRGCLDKEAVLARYRDNDGGYNPPAVDDIWDITIEQAKQPSKRTETASYDVVKFNGKLMKDVSAIEAINYLIIEFDKHRQHQKLIVNSQLNRVNTIQKCPHEGCIMLKGFCNEHCDELQPQVGISTVYKVCKYGLKARRTVRNIKSKYNALKDVATDVLYNRAYAFECSWDWISFLNQDALDMPLARRAIFWYNRKNLEQRAKKQLMFLWMFPLFMLFVNYYMFLFMCSYATFSSVYVMSSVKEQYITELKSRRDGVTVIIKAQREKYAKILCASALSIAALYSIARAYFTWKKLDVQGSLEPTTVQEIETRSNQINVWNGSTSSRTVISPVAMTSTLDHMKNIIDGNLFYGSAEVDGKRYMVNLLFVASNLVLIPNHYFKELDVLTVTSYHKNPAAPGGIVDLVLEQANGYRIPNTDFILCYTSRGGSRKDITHLFPKSKPVDTPFVMLYRQKNGEILEAKGYANMKNTSNSLEKFFGGEYRSLSINTFGGLCGACILSDSREKFLLGLHLGGQADTPRGCFGTIFYDDIISAVAALQKKECNVITGAAGMFSPQVLGVQVLTDKPLHPKSPLNFMPPKVEFNYLGSCPGETTYYSDVKVTPTSEHVMDICGVPNIWGPPKMKPEWEAYQKTLANMAEPAKPFPIDLLTVAVKDYKEPLISLIKQQPYWQSMKPLSHLQTINGIVGCKFIDSMTSSTSIGYPLSGAKSQYFIELDPDEEFPCKRDFQQDILDEITRVGNLYKSGFRAYNIAKACKKDEVLPMAKGKCRIFYANGIAQTYWVRRLFLPIIRFLQMNPILAECAVGINCHSDEWEQLISALEKFGEDNWIAGDYSKYDQRLPSQVLLASFRILIDLARECNYSEEDLIMMEAMAGDVVYSLIAFNGDLIELLCGSHISGNSLTVILNGMCGSINLRCAFYTFYPTTDATFDTRKKFREYASMVTYGDDNAGTASPEVPLFSIKNISSLLEKYGQVYTMPDKESELADRMNQNDVEFLKRRSSYLPELGIRVGALDEQSIFKSLHCVTYGKRSPVTLNEIAAMNIDGALREWFNHGRKVYNMRQTQMQAVAKASGLEHICAELNLTYDDRIQKWIQLYRPETTNFGSDE
jgi:hypothetical protein